MLLNRAKFEAADIRFDTRFNKVLNEWREQIPIADFMMVVPSTGRKESYLWANAFPKVKEWVSDAQFTRLQGYGFTIENKFWQEGIEVLREDIEDDSLGIVRPQIDQLAQEFAFHPQDLMYALLVGGFAGTLGLSYDGQNFFDSDHADGLGPVQSNVATYKFSENSLNAALTQMRSLKSEDGRALRIQGTDLYVSPSNEHAARRVVEADTILQGGAAVSNTFNGVVKLHVWNRLAEHPDMWFVLDQSKALKPFVYQEREKVVFAAQDRLTDEQVFMRRMLRWSAFSRDNAGYAMWQLAFGSDGSSAAL